MQPPWDYPPLLLESVGVTRDYHKNCQYVTYIPHNYMCMLGLGASNLCAAKCINVIVWLFWAKIHCWSGYSGNIYCLLIFDSGKDDKYGEGWSEGPDCTQKTGNIVICLYGCRDVDELMFLSTQNHWEIPRETSLWGWTPFDNHPNTKTSTSHKEEVQVYLFKAEVWIWFPTKP